MQVGVAKYVNSVSKPGLQTGMHTGRHTDRHVWTPYKPHIGSESQFLPTHVHPTPPLSGGFRQNIAVTFGTEKLEWCGYRKVKKMKMCLFVFTECMYERDRHTGRQTNGHRMTRLHSIVQQKIGNKTA